MDSELAQQILNLKNGDHLCLFYDKDPAEQMPRLFRSSRRSWQNEPVYLHRPTIKR